MKPLTYNQICSLMNDIPTRSNKERQKQLANWNKIYNITKNGRFYYLESAENTDKRNKYSYYIKQLLPSKEENFSYSQLFNELGIVNDLYYKAKYNKELYISEFITNDMDYEYIMKNMTLFFNISYKILKKMIDRVLKSMENKSDILSNKIIILYKKEYNHSTKSYFTKKHICNAEETAKFLEIQKQTLKEFKLNSLKDIFYLDINQKICYNTFINKKIKEILGYDFYSNGANIIYRTGYEQEEINKKEIKKKLNDNIQRKLLTSKEMEIISKSLNEQFVDKFIKL